MLTPKLEQLIWDGKAEYKTWTIGTPSAQLPVGQNETVIITDVKFFPFIDAAGDSFEDPALGFKRANKQMVFSSKNKRFNLLARSTFLPFTGVLCFPIDFNTYFVFNETINFFCLNIEPTGLPWVIVNGLAPGGTDAKGAPLGYGQVNDNGLTGINRIQMTAPGEIRPHQNTPAATANGYNFSSTEFEVPASAATILNNPSLAATEIGNYQYPLITVHYVKIFENLKQKFV